MAQQSWPSPEHNARAVTDVEYERLAARFSDDGVYGTPADTRVVTPGVGLSVVVRADVAASVRGHGWYSGTDPVTVPLPPNETTQPRVDWIVLRLDRSDWTVRAVPVIGTPGSGAPALTQQTGDTGVYEIPLARVSVLGGALSVTVTRAEQYVGARIRPCTSTTRNPHPTAGEFAFETDTGRVLMWDGSAWLLIYRAAETANVDSPVSAWVMNGASVLERRGDVVTLRLAHFERKGTLSAASDSKLPVLIPADHRHAYLQLHDVVFLSGNRVGVITIYPKNHDVRPGQVWLTVHPGLSNTQVVYSKTITWTV